MANILNKWTKFLAVGCSHGSHISQTAREAVLSFKKRMSAHQLRRGARARDGSRYLCTGNSARTRLVGLPTHGRCARCPFFRLQFGPGPASSAHTNSNCHLFDRHAPRAPRRPRHRNLPRPRPTTREGATAASAGVKDRARHPLPLMHRRRDGGGRGKKW